MFRHRSAGRMKIRRIEPKLYKEFTALTESLKKTEKKTEEYKKRAAGLRQDSESPRSSSVVSARSLKKYKIQNSVQETLGIGKNSRSTVKYPQTLTRCTSLTAWKLQIITKGKIRKQKRFLKWHHEKPAYEIPSWEPHLQDLIFFVLLYAAPLGRPAIHCSQIRVLLMVIVHLLSNCEVKDIPDVSSDTDVVWGFDSEFKGKQWLADFFLICTKFLLVVWKTLSSTVY